jgi:integrase
MTATAYFTSWVKRIDRKPATLATYRRLVEQRICPALGATLLSELTPDKLKTAYEHLLADGLSATYVQLIHQVINKALGDAEKDGLITKNPARRVEAPRKAVLDMRTWTADEVTRFLKHVSEDRLFAMWRLFLTTGMRRGEVAALRWTDVDLTHGRLSVRQTGNVINRVWTVGSPKGRGRGATRMLSLDPKTVHVLVAHREAQQVERAEAVDFWQESGLVFCREDGSPLNPTRIGHHLTAHARRAGLPPIRVHDLRHTYATLALLAGIHPKVVSERLGHANISITLNLYSHVTAGMDREAAETVARLLE